jgi:hypothetical protein
VMLTTQDMRTRRGKLNPRYLGPYRVKRIVSPVNVELDLPRSMRIRPIFHVSKLKPYQNNDETLFPDRQQLDRPSPVIEDDGGEYFKIECILDKRKRRKGRHYETEYLVKWLGYDESEATWTSKQDMTEDAHTFIDEYEQGSSEGVMVF